MLRAKPAFYLLLQYLFDLPDFLLNLASQLFSMALVLQVGVLGDLASFLFYCAFHLMDLAFKLVLRAPSSLFSLSIQTCPNKQGMGSLFSDPSQ